jgi:zinc/manganese transport system substrate-binding protein
MILNFDLKPRMPAIVLALALLVSACGGTAATEDRMRIVASTSILGDIVTEIVGDGAIVEVVMGPGIDPHDFEVSARQAEDISEADLVIAFGLGLEESLLDVIESQAPESLLLGPELEPMPFTGGHPDEEDHDDENVEEDDHAGGLDPHVWLDPLRMAESVQLIADRVEALDPSLDISPRAEDYIDQLERLHAEISQTLGGIPAAGRKLVTSHDALGYFADRYDFEVIGVIVSGGSTLAEPSAADLATLVDAIANSGVRAIFTDAYNPTTLADAVASEVQSDVAVVPLITGSLTDEADSYAEMMRLNADRIAQALGDAG